MIVFDASVLVGAASRRQGNPRSAFLHALRVDQPAISNAVMAELRGVFSRPRLARFLDPMLSAEVIESLLARGIWFEPAVRVTDCRDPKDNIYLELALAAGAGVIVSSDADLLALDPWRGVRILRPADYLSDSGLPPA